jgi:hypothetical protein
MGTVFLLWVPFRAASLGDAAEVLRALARPPSQLSAPTLVYSGLTVQRALAVLVIAVLVQPLIPRVASWMRSRVRLGTVPVSGMLGAVTVAYCVLAVLIAPAANPPFIYFQF